MIVVYANLAIFQIPSQPLLTLSP